MNIQLGKLAVQSPVKTDRANWTASDDANVEAGDMGLTFRGRLSTSAGHQFPATPVDGNTQGHKFSALVTSDLRSDDSYKTSSGNIVSLVADETTGIDFPENFCCYQWFAEVNYDLLLEHASDLSAAMGGSDFDLVHAWDGPDGRASSPVIKIPFEGSATRWIGCVSSGRVELVCSGSAPARMVSGGVDIIIRSNVAVTVTDVSINIRNYRVWGIPNEFCGANHLVLDLGSGLEFIGTQKWSEIMGKVLPAIDRNFDVQRIWDAKIPDPTIITELADGLYTYLCNTIGDQTDSAFDSIDDKYDELGVTGGFLAMSQVSLWPSSEGPLQGMSSDNVSKAACMFKNDMARMSEAIDNDQAFTAFMLSRFPCASAF
jgi:hypothetical protein